MTGAVNRFWFNVVLFSLLFVPCQHILVFAHEYGHGIVTYLTGGWFSEVTLNSGLFGGGNAMCADGWSDGSIAAGLAAMGVAGLLSLRFGAWYMAIAAGVRVLCSVGSSVFDPASNVGSDTCRLVDGSPVARSLLVLVVVLGLVSLWLGVVAGLEASGVPVRARARACLDPFWLGLRRRSGVGSGALARLEEVKSALVLVKMAVIVDADAEAGHHGHERDDEELQGVGEVADDSYHDADEGAGDADAH